MLQRQNAMNDTSIPSGRNWKRLCWAASWLALAGVCLAKAIPTSYTSARAEPKAASIASVGDGVSPLLAKRVQLHTKSIEHIRVGDRVLGKDPQLAEKDRSAVDPDPATWRKLQLRMTKNSGKRLDIVMLRPVGWIQREHAKAGERVRLNLPELGAVGEAEVLSVSPCPPLTPGKGSVVTATLAHQADDNLVNVRLEGLAEPIGSTAKHPFWSEDRHDFVPAESLRHGERVRSATAGTVAVLAVSRRPPEMQVFNLEVHGEHVYEVASLGILVHNTGCETASKDGHFADWELRGPRGGLVAAGDEVSGVEFALPPGTKLSFPEQSWHGHTEGKTIANLMEGGQLRPGRTLSFEGELPPCSTCQNIMKWTSKMYQMQTKYMDSFGNLWAWKDGILVWKP